MGVAGEDTWQDNGIAVWWEFYLATASCFSQQSLLGAREVGRGMKRKRTEIKTLYTDHKEIYLEMNLSQARSSNMFYSLFQLHF